MYLCKKCHALKCSSEFYKRSSNKNGLYSYCKTCSSADCRAYHSKNREKNLESLRQYREKNRSQLNEKAKKYYRENRDQVLKKAAIFRAENKSKISLRESERRIEDEERFEKNRKKHLAWSSKNRERINRYQQGWYSKNKEKRRAHVLLKRAIEKGLLIRPSFCSQCKRGCKPDGHHVDYNKPLDVIWLCRKCHSRKSPRTVLDEHSF